MKFTLYIDESGDSGIKKVRTANTPGASPYFVLGAALVPNKHIDNCKNSLDGIARKFGRSDLHSNKLAHRQKIYFAKAAVKLPIRFFGVISYKATLLSYSEQISHGNVKFYNKCTSYLLECVGQHLELCGIHADDVEICLEDGPTDYVALANYISVIQKKPQYSRAKLLQNLNANNIYSKTKSECKLLELADFVAHALYSTVDKSDGKYQITEPRYLKELEQKLYHDPENGIILGRGIKAINNLRDLKLDHQTAKFFKTLNVSEENRILIKPEN